MNAKAAAIFITVATTGLIGTNVAYAQQVVMFTGSRAHRVLLKGGCELLKVTLETRGKITGLAQKDWAATALAAAQKAREATGAGQVDVDLRRGDVEGPRTNNGLALLSKVFDRKCGDSGGNFYIATHIMSDRDLQLAQLVSAMSIAEIPDEDVDKFIRRHFSLKKGWRLPTTGMTGRNDLLSLSYSIDKAILPDLDILADAARNRPVLGR